MDAREYLGQVRVLRKVIKNHKNHIEEMRCSYIGIGSMTGDADRVQTSPSINGMYDLVDRILDLERDLSREIMDLELKIREIDSQLQHLSKDLYVDVIRGKWIEDKSLEQLCVEMHLSFPYIRRLYWQAMCEMQKITEKY